MMFTHDFARPETFHRATYWLMRLGIDRSRMQVDPQGHRISFTMGLGEFAEAEALITALESAEDRLSPEVDPRLWDACLMPSFDSTPTTISRTSPIGWHPEADQEPTEPGLNAVFEAIRRTV